ncbi:MAG: potassium channel family protein [Limisphaerales bacterium]
MSEFQPPKPEAVAPSPPAAQPAQIGYRRFSTAEFLVALVLLFVAAPFVEKMPFGRSIEHVLMTLVLVSGVLAVGRSHRTLVWAAVLMVPAVVGRWMNHFLPELAPAEISLVAGLVFVVFLVVQFLRFILRAPRVNAEVMYAGISVYLLLGLSWMFAYQFVARLVPGSFAFNAGPAGQAMDGFTAYYFSFVTLTTVGYGDITPVSNGARALAAMEAMTGTLYVAVLISRLVALYSSQGSRLREPEPPETDKKLSTPNSEKE